MRAFKVRCFRNEDGSYTLSYGKGGNKLTSPLVKYSNGWQADNTVLFAKKRDAVEEWAEWAKANYKYSATKEGAGVPDSRPAANHSSDEPGCPESVETAPSCEDDDLSEWERNFFEKLSQKRGRLNEWQRSQAIAIFRRLLNVPEPYKSPPPPGKPVGEKTDVKFPGPPPFKPKPVEAKPEAGETTIPESGPTEELAESEVSV